MRIDAYGRLFVSRGLTLFHAHGTMELQKLWTIFPELRTRILRL